MNFISVAYIFPLLIALIEIIIQLRKNKFNFYVFTLSFYLFGSSIISLLFGVYMLGPLIGICILAFMFTLYILMNGKVKLSNNVRNYIGLMFGLILLFSIWTFFSDRVIYAIEKDIFFIVTLVSVVFTSITFTKEEHFRSLLLYIYFWLLLYVLLVIHSIDISSDVFALTRGYEAGENRIILTRYLLILSMLAFYFYTERGKKYLRLLHLSTIPCTIYLITVSSARGPIIAMIITLLIISLKKIRLQTFFKPKNGAKLVIIILISYLFINFVVQNVDILQSKFVLLYRIINNSNFCNPELNTRASLFFSLINYIQNDLTFTRILFGYGFGDSLTHIGHKYPHNFYMELFLEMGLVGLMCSCLFLYKFMKIFSFSIHDKMQKYLLVIFGIYFFSSMVSGAIHTHTNLFLFYMISLKYNETLKKTTDKHLNKIGKNLK